MLDSDVIKLIKLIKQTKSQLNINIKKQKLLNVKYTLIVNK